MAYEPKPGSFSLFKNDRREKETHPEYKGDGLLPDGTPAWISAWVKEGARGKFFSISIQPKQPRADADSFRGGRDGGVSRGSGDVSRASPAFDDDADVPF